MADPPVFSSMRSEFLVEVETSFEEGIIDGLKNKFNTLQALNAQKVAALEQALRDKLLAILEKRGYTKDTFEKFISLCISLCREKMITPVMSVILLGDIFDATTLDICQSLFEFVERNVSTWKESLFFATCKNNILRMCNDLLRRLSKSQNTIFCGRILLFLAMFFPFSERSGLNIVSEFNLDNVTKYGTESNQEDMDTSTMEEIVHESSIKIDYNFYVKFWSLQDYFRSPNQCYNKVQWKEFINHSNAVLSVFKNYKVEADPMEFVQSKTEGQHYFAKFLTNQKLLVLQLNDVNFRRTIYLQFLILFQFLNAHVKSKPESFELKPDQVEWVKETTELIHRLIRETPPDGEQFMESVLKILEREEHWNNWKNEGCPALKPVSAKGEGAAVRPKIEEPVQFGRVLQEDKKDTDKFYVVCKDGSKLWHMNNDGEMGKCEVRQFVPSLKTFFEEVIQQADPSAMIEPKYKKVNDIRYAWAALRLLRQKSPHFYAIAHNPIPKLPDFIEEMCKKISKEPYYNQTAKKNKPPPTTYEEDQFDTAGIFKLPEKYLKEYVKKEEEATTASSSTTITSTTIAEEIKKREEEKEVMEVEIEDDVEVDVGPGADSDTETKGEELLESKEPADEEEAVDEEEEEELDEEEEVDEEVEEEEEEEEEIEDEEEDEEEEVEELEVEGTAVTTTTTTNDDEEEEKPKAKKEKLNEEEDMEENSRKRLKTSHDVSSELSDDEITVIEQQIDKHLEVNGEPAKESGDEETTASEKPTEEETKDTAVIEINETTEAEVKSEELIPIVVEEALLEEDKVLETTDDNEVIEIDLEKVQDQSLIQKIMGDESLEEEKRLLGETEDEKKEEEVVKPVSSESKNEEPKEVKEVEEERNGVEEKVVIKDEEKVVIKDKEKVVIKDEEKVVIKDEEEEEEEETVTKEKKKPSPEKRSKLSEKQLDQIAKALGSNWPKVCEKLGYKGSEIKRLASKGSNAEKCKLLLEKWLKKSDTSTEKLQKCLKSLGFDSAARVISI